MEVAGLETYIHAGVCVILFGIGFIAGQQR